MNTAQKGRSDLKLASLRRDRELVALAREVAFEIVDADPMLDEQPAAARRAAPAVHRRRRSVPVQELTPIAACAVGQTARMRRSLAALATCLVVFSACSDSRVPAPTRRLHRAKPPPPIAGEPEGTQTFTDLEQTHVDTPVDYPQTPPVGGPHNPVWQTCAFYDVEFPKERGVHSMEHGAVWITYTAGSARGRPGSAAGVRRDGKEVLVSPFAGLPTPVVASAPGASSCSSSHVTDPRLAQFVDILRRRPADARDEHPLRPRHRRNRLA